MSKQIKVDDEVYNQLERFKARDQTFSQAIEQLLNSRQAMLTLMSILEGQLKYREWQERQLHEVVSADSVRRDIEAQTISRPKIR